MERCTYPFPLAVHSSHHSHYHRFLLGAEPSILSPFPKPYCVGALKGHLHLLAHDLNLPKWRKLFGGALPWVEGFGPRDYDIGNVASHRPLPRAYGRPPRRYGAFDFVQIADPSVSALALVAGDRRVLERFVALGDDFASRVEAGAGTRVPGPTGARITGRMLAGQFFEPNNRWLMPLLHVHTRVLNFTSPAEAPAKLACVDAAALGRSAQRAMREWAGLQADALSGLGYQVSIRGERAPSLRVDGVSARLLAAVDAPRIAVLRLLERIIMGDRPPSAERLCAELPPEVIAAMAEQLEAMLARSLSPYKPAKLGLPSEGPWRAAVREHLSGCCADALAGIDAAARKAGAAIAESAIFPSPPLDPAHCHAPGDDALVSRLQMPTDPELGPSCEPRGPQRATSRWLAHEFDETLREVNERLVRFGPDDPIVSLRSLLSSIDSLPGGADPDQLRQADQFLGVELERKARQPSLEGGRDRQPVGGEPFPLAPLDQLFETACMERSHEGHEIGGRSL